VTGAVKPALILLKGAVAETELNCGNERDAEDERLGEKRFVSRPGICFFLDGAL
jgi:hypothetical protein